jgi:hypothetical protein
MGIWGIIGIVATAAGTIIGAVSLIVSNAFKKGVNDQKIHDAHERVMAYENKSV